MQIAFDDGENEWRKQWMFEAVEFVASQTDSDLEEDYDVWEQRYDAERAAEAPSHPQLASHPFLFSDLSS